MAVTTWTAGQVLTAADLNDTLASKLPGVVGSVSDSVSVQITAQRARAGTTAVQDGDNLLLIDGQGFDGTDYQTAARLLIRADGAVSAGNVPGSIRGVIGSTSVFLVSSDGGIYLGNDALNLQGSYQSSTNIATGQVRVATTGSSNTGSVSMESVSTSTSARHHISFTNPNGVVGSISTSSSATAYNTSSDYRLKQDVEPISGALARLEQLNPIRFAWKADPSSKVDGFLAHEAQAVVPEAVTGEKDEVDENGNPAYQGIDQSKLVPLLVAAVQELAAEVAALKAAQP